MKEDIKILNNLIAFLNTNGDYIADENFKEEKQAIENLIKGYRELEKKVEKQELSYVRGYNDGAHNQLDVMDAKIKEKIEELRKEPLKIKQNDKYYFETDAYNKIIIQVLQELMEDK